jgi:hypothetical protein
MFLIKINVPTNLFIINLCYFKNSKLLLFVNKNLTFFYKDITHVSIKKTKNSLLSLEASWRYLNNFSNFYRNLIFKARGFLILKGLGLKVQIIDDLLEFKLGYSHKCYLKIDPEISVKIKKNLIFFQSVNKERLGNFLYRIKMLKKPDVYKGKGIWYKNEKIGLKPVKKSK